MTMIDLALLILRVVLGLIFIAHGSQKLFGWFGGPGLPGVNQMMGKLGLAYPNLFTWLNALAEFGGGLLVLFGLLTPLGAALIIGVMAVAIARIHAQNGFFNTNRGYEFNLSLMAQALALLLAGAGAVSLDQALGLAIPLDQLPLWAVVLLLLIPFAGLLITELARQTGGASRT